MSLVQIVLLIKYNPLIIVNSKVSNWVADRLPAGYRSSRASCRYDLVSIGFNCEVKITRNALVGCECEGIHIFINGIVLIVPSILITLRFSLMPNLVVREAVLTNKFADGYNK